MYFISFYLIWLTGFPRTGSTTHMYVYNCQYVLLDFITIYKAFATFKVMFKKLIALCKSSVSICNKNHPNL